MKAIVVLMDSLNRHYLPAYGNRWVQTPNIDAFATRSVVFDSHWIGSAPCMPARRDIFTGRLGFLERQWGGLEPARQALVLEKMCEQARKGEMPLPRYTWMHRTAALGPEKISALCAWAEAEAAKLKGSGR